MGHDFGTLSHAMTKQDYDRQEAAGNINRPITDRGMKAASTALPAPKTPSKGDGKTDRVFS